MADGGVDLALQLLRVLGDGSGLEVDGVLGQPPLGKRLEGDLATVLRDPACDFFLKLPDELLQIPLLLLLCA